FKTLWEELQICDPLPHCKCEAANEHLFRREREKSHQFLLGLNNNFDRLRSNVLSMDPTPSLNRIFSLALQEEQSFMSKDLHSIPALEGAAFAARSDYEGHERTRFNKNQNSGNRLAKRCEHCKKTGHVKEECFEIIGYPMNWRNKSNQRQRYSNM